MVEPEKKEVRKRITLDLTPEEHRGLKIVAAASGQTMRNILRQLLREVLPKTV